MGAETASVRSVRSEGRVPPPGRGGPPRRRSWCGRWPRRRGPWGASCAGRGGDAAADVPRGALGSRRVRHRGTLAADRRGQGLQVEGAGHRDDRDDEGAVDVRDQRLEDAVRGDAHRLGRLLAVRGVRGVVLVGVDRVRDARRRQSHGRRCAPGLLLLRLLRQGADALRQLRLVGPRVRSDAGNDGRLRMIAVSARRSFSSSRRRAAVSGVCSSRCLAGMSSITAAATR